MAKKRICFICDDLSVFGGAERATTNTVNHLVKNAEIYLLSINQKNASPAFTVNTHIHYHFFKRGNYRTRYLLTIVPWKIRRYLKKNKIDLVICANQKIAIPVIMATRFSKIETMLTDHGALMNEIDLTKPTFRRKCAARWMGKIIVLTQKSKQDYLLKFSLNPEKVVCIPNAIDDRLYPNNIKYNRKNKKIISVTRISEEKGLDLLIKIAKRVYPKNKDWQWNIYGNGPQFKEIEDQIKQNYLENFVFLRGNDPKVYERYPEHGLCVLTSYQEGLPLVLLEAKACKLPLVSFDVNTGPGEIIQDGVNGFLISPYNIDLMTNKICALLEDEQLRQNFSDHAYTGIDAFSTNAVIKQWKALLKI